MGKGQHRLRAVHRRHRQHDVGGFSDRSAILGVLEPVLLTAINAATSSATSVTNVMVGVSVGYAIGLLVNLIRASAPRQHGSLEAGRHR
jgi:hypothetical protein